MKLAIPLLLSLMACGPNDYKVAEEANTIEAFALFLKENPDHRHAFLAKATLEGLYWEKAQNENSVDAWDAYLNRYPNADKVKTKDGGQAREKAAYKVAETANTRASWEAFLSQYKFNKSFLKDDAEKRLVMVEHLDQIVLSELSVNPVNLAEDPEKEPNGYAVSVDVNNNTGKTIKFLMLKMDFMSDSDGSIQEERWPMIAEMNPDKTNRTEEERAYLKSGEIRNFYFTLEPPGIRYNEGEADERWNRKVVVTPVSVVFEE
jgi:hypothetical protein